MKKDIPQDYIELDDNFCSNFDGIINENVVNQLKSGNFYAAYPAWEFYGSVWFDKETQTFCCRIMRYQSHVETIEAFEPREIIDECCDRYGHT